MPPTIDDARDYISNAELRIKPGVPRFATKPVHTRKPPEPRPIDDEAHALAGDRRAHGADHFSQEAVRTLLTELENHRTQLCVVFAGYRDKMNGFMRCDPGLPRRLPQSFHLPDYTPRQLVKIMRRVSVDAGHCPQDEAPEAVNSALVEWMRRLPE